MFQHFKFLLLPVVAGLVLSERVSADILTVTVNSSGHANTADGELTFPEAVLLMNTRFATDVAARTLGRELTAEEAALVRVETAPTTAREIRFNIPGAADTVHWITAPPGGFPILFADSVLIDGYSQPGASPNTNPITAPNTARLRIGWDVRTLTAEEEEGAVPDYTFKIQASEVVIQGISVVSSRETDNYGVTFAENANGGRISGCWFGISPGLDIVQGSEVAVAAFGSLGGHVVGTNGDGVDDHAEFNVIVAHAIGLMFEDTGDISVAGNFIGVMPDGVTMPSEEIRQSLEGDAVEGAGLSGQVVIGTNSDGIADDSERNIIGGMKDDVVEFYGPVENFVFAGNTVGLGIDGVTPLPVRKLLRAPSGHFRIGSDLDGSHDDAEGNTLANFTGFLIRYTRGLFLSFRGNDVRDNSGPIVSNEQQSYLASLLGGVPVEELRPVLVQLDNPSVIQIQAPLPASEDPGSQSIVIDLYRAVVVPAANPEAPGILEDLTPIASQVDNMAGDLDPRPGFIAIALAQLQGDVGDDSLVAFSTLQLPSAVETGPPSRPLRLTAPPQDPALRIARHSEGVRITWEGEGWTLQERTSVAGGEWVSLATSSPAILPVTGQSRYFRLVRGN
ncbi:MAG: hypothetical protein FJ405_03255 [Verrucomicrobia bacterium]|nr:hypothetical protein [Verrucomicrobiota bacterium]